MKARNISVRILKRIWATPCVVCGIPFDIHCDHIVPVAKGGTADERNLQALCRDCNYIKRHTRTNEEVAKIVLERGDMHFLYATYRWDTRTYNPYDGPSFGMWRSSSPQRVEFALGLAKKFAEANT